MGGIPPPRRGAAAWMDGRALCLVYSECRLIRKQRCILSAGQRRPQDTGKERATPMTFQATELLQVTDIAAEKAGALLKDKGVEGGALRVFVVGGGCSGFQYGMALATEVEEGDAVIEHK